MGAPGSGVRQSRAAQIAQRGCDDEVSERGHCRPLPQLRGLQGHGILQENMNIYFYLIYSAILGEQTTATTTSTTSSNCAAMKQQQWRDMLGPKARNTPTAAA